MKSSKSGSRTTAKIVKGSRADSSAVNEDYHDKRIHRTSRVITATPIGPAESREWLVEIEHDNERKNASMDDLELLSRLLADSPDTKRCKNCLKSKSLMDFRHIRLNTNTLTCYYCRRSPSTKQCAARRDGSIRVNEELGRLGLPYRICNSWTYIRSPHLRPAGDFLQLGKTRKECAPCRARARSGKINPRKTKPQPPVHNYLPFCGGPLAEAYLYGRPIQALSDSLYVPLPDLLSWLQICLLLFCEHNDHELKSVLHDENTHLKFCQGLMKQHSGYVDSVLKKCPWLDTRLKVPEFRRRIVDAFSNVQFDKLNEEVVDLDGLHKIVIQDMTVKSLNEDDVWILENKTTHAIGVGKEA
ncbi:hypothetical protein F4820DRAFT_359700 [Hypoxylon rubiginosum]|uniref:Uncharacterized protein n=1 Tax=Hypoxylon rubiginosum TaxID=110542 RepID=A0ACB9YX66_9PEZI|nr:hypothetical protein F4820DRAFT_359700 [Hypoxylon rubiginosum]